jgi:hypothetical protein
MGNVKIHVWHEVTGKIIAIGRPGIKSSHQAIPLSGENQFVFETEIEEGNIKELYKTHIVDVKKKALVKVKL